MFKMKNKCWSVLVGVYFLFLIQQFSLFECVYPKEKRQNDITLGYIYIQNDSSSVIVLAEPHTLYSNRAVNITVRTTLRPLYYDINFVWVILPTNNQRFMQTEGLGTISQFTNSTQISVSTRDTNLSDMDDVLYFFNLDRITTNFINLTQRYFINSTAGSLPIRLLPSNYPFGYFEFSSKLPSNFTVSRYSYYSYADSITILRKYGNNYRVLVTYNEIELTTNSKITKFLEFNAFETQKTINFSLVYKTETQANLQAKYPRNFMLSLTSVSILDGVPDIVNDPLILKSTDILPKIGNFSTIHITVIDDESIVEFIDRSIEVNVDSIYRTTENVMLTLSRSSISNVEQKVIVDFVTVPLYHSNFRDENYYPARPYIDYSPAYGQFIFLPGAKTSNYVFSIYQYDENYFTNINRKLRIYLLSIKNCDSCRFGFNNQANIYITAIKEPFRGLLIWDDAIKNNSIYLNAPLYSSTQKGLAIEKTRICGTRKSNQSIKLDYEVVLVDINNPLAYQFQVNYLNSASSASATTNNQLNPNLKNESLYFNSSNPNIQCVELGVSILRNNIASAYCYNITYLLNFYTYYVLSNRLKIYSPIISYDSFKLFLFNSNCTLIQFNTSHLIINETETNHVIVKTSHSDSLAHIQVDLPDLINYQANDIFQIKIPILITNNWANIDSFEITYQISVDPSLLKYFSNSFSLNTMLTTTLFSSKQNFISFNLINMKNYPFYLINVNITIFNNRMGSFRVYYMVNSNFSTNSLYSATLSVDFITKYTDDPGNCGVISLEKSLSKFSYLTKKRQIILTFTNSLPLKDENCMINVLYTINKVDSTLATIQDVNDFINNDANDFFYLFTPIKGSTKEVLVNNDVYMDTTDLFLVNITSITSVKLQTTAFLKSANDKQILLSPTLIVSNGDAQLDAWLYFVLNQTNPYDINNYDLRVNINLNRVAYYSKVQAVYELLLIDPLDGTRTSDPNAIDKGINLVNITLKDGETNKTIDVDIQYLSDSDSKRIYGDLILVGSVCFFDQSNIEIYCTKTNDQIIIEPDGIFMFNDTSSLKFTVSFDNYLPNSSETSLSLYAERHFGSRNMVNLIYAITSLNSYVDLFFSGYTKSFLNAVTFNESETINSFSLNIVAVSISAPREFFVYLINVESLESFMYTLTFFYESSKIYKYNNFAQITILPSESYSNTIVFSQNYLMIPILPNTTKLDLNLTVLRLGLPKNSTNSKVYCSLISVGYNEMIPSYIIANDRLYNYDMYTMAYPNLNYESIHTDVVFTEDQTGTNVSLSIYGNFTIDHDPLSSLDDNDFSYTSRFFFLYLLSPKNGARLIEPSINVSYSPYIKIELRKFSKPPPPINESLKVGFYQSDTTNLLNQTLYLENMTSNNFIYLLSSDRVINNNSYINEIYQIKWRAEIISMDQLNEAIIDGSSTSIRDIIKCGFYSFYSSTTSNTQKKDNVYCEEIINCKTTNINCNLIVSFKSNIKIFRDYLLRFTLISTKTSYFSTSYLNVSIVKQASVAYLYLKSNAHYLTTVGFNRNSLLSFNNKLKLYTDLKVERTGILNETVKVFYTTREFSDLVWFYFNNIKIYSADAIYDFEQTSGFLTFLPGVTEQTIRIGLRATTILNNYAGPGLNPLIFSYMSEMSPNLYPRMFQVALVNCTPNCNMLKKSYISNVTILTENINLWRVYRQALNGDLQINLNEIEKRSLDVSPEITMTESDLIVETLQKTIAQQYNLLTDSKNISLVQSRQSTILNILCNLMNPNRVDIKGKVEYATLLEETLYVDLYKNPICIQNLSLTNLTYRKFSCSYASFNYACNKYDTKFISQVNYSGQYFQTEIPLKSESNQFLNTNTCFDVCIIELSSLNWIQPTDHLLDDKAISLSIRQARNLNETILDLDFESNFTTNNLSYPIIIRMMFAKSIQTAKKCSIYNSDLSSWDFNFCKTTKGYDYIQCSCFHKSIYGILLKTDPLYYGFSHTWLYLSISFKIFGTVSAIVTYFVCLKVYSFISFCLMQLIAANTFAQILYLITASISPSVIVNEPDGNNGSCIVLSLFFHFFILTQFTWILFCSLAFYLKFIRNIKYDFQVKLIFSLVAWLLPIIIIGIFYLITSLVYRFNLNYSPAFIYTDVLDNTEFCFIKNVWAYVGGLIIPSLILFLLAFVLIFLLFKDLNSWKLFDNIYLGRFNYFEVYWIMGLWLLIFIVNFWAALQIRYGYLWLFILFCIFDILLGIYVLLFYTLARHISKISIFNKSNNSTNKMPISSDIKSSIRIMTKNSYFNDYDDDDGNTIVNNNNNNINKSQMGTGRNSSNLNSKTNPLSKENNSSNNNNNYDLNQLVSIFRNIAAYSNNSTLIVRRAPSNANSNNETTSITSNNKSKRPDQSDEREENLKSSSTELNDLKLLIDASNSLVNDNKNTKNSNNNNDNNNYPSNITSTSKSELKKIDNNQQKEKFDDSNSAGVRINSKPNNTTTTSTTNTNKNTDNNNNSNNKTFSNSKNKNNLKYFDDDFSNINNTKL